MSEQHGLHSITKRSQNYKLDNKLQKIA